MYFERFIAKQFLPKDRNGYSGPLVSIATYSIALGVVIMIMAVCILRGFQGEIRQKAVGFGSHIVVQNYDMGNTYQQEPISSNRMELQQIRTLPGVKHLQCFANKGGMIKTNDQIHGIIMKGVERGFDSSFFASNLTQGRLFQFNDSAASNEVIISQTIANKLNIAVGDKLRTYFWQGSDYRARAFTVTGLYRTDLTDFDNHYIVGDIAQIQKLNGWDSIQVAGYEILVDDFSNINAVAAQVLQMLSYDLTLSTIVDQNPALFSWLDLLDSNIVLIITIMALVCIVSIISALLIMIFEKTSTIGVLKTLGANNSSIRNIFLYKSASIIGKGILIGNVVALAFCVIQYKYHWVRLDSESYSMDFVPIDLNLWGFLIISIGTLAVCLLALLIPTAYIAKIQPAKTIKFD